MKLKVSERILLLNILAAYEGNYISVKATRELNEKLGLNEDEVAIWQPRVYPDGRYEWKTKDDDGNAIPQDAEVEIGEVGKDIIRQEMVKLNGTGRLKVEHLELYEKFVFPSKE